MTATCKLSLAVLSVLIGQNLTVAQPVQRGHLPHQTTTTAAFTQSTWLGINRIKISLSNHGGLDNKNRFEEAAFWPDTTMGSSYPFVTSLVYDCGPWVVGKYNGVPSMGYSQWESSYSPGPVINGQAAMLAAPSDSLRYRLYRIKRGDNPDNNPDYKDWPVDFGAPVDAQGKPRLYGDETAWNVFNNLDSTVPRYRDVVRLPVEVQQTVYGHEVRGGDTSALLANVIFLEWTIVNKGSAQIESTYVSLWTDIDFPDPISNVPAIDTVNQLGYCWQGDRNLFGPPSPEAVGFVWLYGPAVASQGKTAVFRGRLKPGFCNLPLSSYWGIPDDSYPDGFPEGPAYSMSSAWNIARGFNKQGYQIYDSVAHQVTKFPYSGDPVTGSGWLCPQSLVSGGSGFNLFSGPFTLAPNDTQWMMVALVPAAAGDRFASVTLLRQYAAMLRSMSYDMLSVTSVSGSPTTVPQEVHLYQNFPNPFNPTTTIRYAIPQRNYVTLTVFNTLGQQVATLVSESEEAGYHHVKFDGSGLASGVYFYRLRAGEYVATKRLLLVR